MIFTSESVSDGHPDKLCDQVSDAILDAFLTHDPNARVACETLVKTGMVILAGEVRATYHIECEKIVRDTLIGIGYDSPEKGLDAKGCAVISALGEQSVDIAMGVDESSKQAQGAGDQGLMFGYANNETPNYMPAPIDYSHQIMKKHKHLRTHNTLPWLRPDAKCQLSFEYENQKLKGLRTVVLSIQHDPQIPQAELKEAAIEEIIKPTLSPHFKLDAVVYHINPTGQFIIGGPEGDCGLTGRKIIVDTYGGFARHGGGAFSGKDPSKVDRSAAYAARYVAKNLVAAGVADQCEVQLAYAIGVAKPVSIYVKTFGDSKFSPDQISACVDQIFDLTPAGIVWMLDLKRPIYQPTAAFGHFGRREDNFSWEKTDQIEAIQSYLGV